MSSEDSSVLVDNQYNSPQMNSVQASPQMNRSGVNMNPNMNSMMNNNHATSQISIDEH